MDKTTFAGLTRLGPGEPLGTDGYSFQHVNPTITDRLLEVGALSHRHDGHAALADPALDPVVAAVPGGGSIFADATVYGCYTLLDADGGETRRSTVELVTTLAPLNPPDVGPTAVLQTAGGTLLVNTYMYALTLTDANGGETTLGPSTLIQRAPGPPNARVLLSGLQAIVTAAGADGWRLWRSVGGGRFGFLASGTADTYTDSGATSPDCTMNPPSSNSTNGVNQIEVTVPSGQPAGVVSFRVYLSDDGSFDSPSVAGTYPIASAGTPIHFPTLDLGDGSPPAVSLALPGANQINPDTDITNFRWKSAVANAAALPTLGNVNGDVRMTLDTLSLWTWSTDATPDAWVPLPGGGGGGGGSQWKDPVADAAALPALGNTTGDVRLTLNDNVLHTWTGAAWTGVSAGGDAAWRDIGDLANGGPEWGPGGTGTPNAGQIFRPFLDGTGGVVPYLGQARQTPSVLKDASGFVHLKGTFEAYGISPFTASLPAQICKLPVGLRPGEFVFFEIWYWDKVAGYSGGNGGWIVGRLGIYPNGNMKLEQGPVDPNTNDPPATYPGYTVGYTDPVDGDWFNVPAGAMWLAEN